MNTKTKTKTKSKSKSNKIKLIEMQFNVMNLFNLIHCLLQVS